MRLENVPRRRPVVVHSNQSPGTTPVDSYAVTFPSRKRTAL